jgi:hypothetical protein
MVVSEAPFQSHFQPRKYYQRKKVIRISQQASFEQGKEEEIKEK